jgi:hypothetical protein
MTPQSNSLLPRRRVVVVNISAAMQQQQQQQHNYNISLEKKKKRTIQNLDSMMTQRREGKDDMIFYFEENKTKKAYKLI